jgi:hypothetical protein
VNLRDELVEDQKMRADFFKWKIILIAGIGAASAGVGGVQIAHPALMLALIPAICVYVDFLSRDQTLRIIVISQYLHLGGNPEGTARAGTVAKSYEVFVTMADQMSLVSLYDAFRWRFYTSKRSAYAFASEAQDSSTVFVLLSVLLFGLILQKKIPGALFFSVQPDANAGAVLAASSLAGLVVTLLAYITYLRRWVTIEKDFPRKAKRN